MTPSTAQCEPELWGEPLAHQQLATSAGERLRSNAASIEERQAVVAGHRMHVLSAGEGPPLVLLHGLLGLASRWCPLMHRLLPFAAVRAPDALGIGRSERVNGLDPSLAGHSHRLLEWLDSEGLERVDLLGTSHGGAVAMRFAADHPERVRSLVLHAPANPYCLLTRPQIRLLSTKMGGRLGRWLPFAPGRLHRTALAAMYGDPRRMPAGAVGAYVRPLRERGTMDHVLGVLRRWASDMDALAPALPRLQRMRTLLLWGDCDHAVSVASGARLSEILHTPLHILPGLGHLAFEESSAQFAEPLLRFLHSREIERQEREKVRC